MNAEEQKLLLKAPVLVSVLAASRNHKINEAQKADAIRLAHLKTFTSDPVLQAYYEKVEKHFIENFESVVRQFSPFDDVKREALKKEIDRVNEIISGLDQDLAEKMHKSLTAYTEHVKNAEHTVLEHFVFPIPIKGLTE